MQAEDHSHVANQFAEMMKEVGVPELERRTGISGKSLYNYMGGRTSPPLDRAAKIAAACGFRLILEPVGEHQPATVEQRLEAVERQLELMAIELAKSRA